jgi:hypothetical protein
MMWNTMPEVSTALAPRLCSRIAVAGRVLVF